MILPARLSFTHDSVTDKTLVISLLTQKCQVARNKARWVRKNFKPRLYLPLSMWSCGSKIRLKSKNPNFFPSFVEGRGRRSRSNHFKMLHIRSDVFLRDTISDSVVDSDPYEAGNDVTLLGQIVCRLSSIVEEIVTISGILFIYTPSPNKKIFDFIKLIL